jgi:hypothetical protein
MKYLSTVWRKGDFITGALSGTQRDLWTVTVHEEVICATNIKSVLQYRTHPKYNARSKSRLGDVLVSLLFVYK